MSDDVLNQTNGIGLSNEHSEKLLSPGRVNDIVADRLARQEEKLRRQFDEDLNRIKSSLPNEEAIASRVRSELEIQYKKDLEAQQQAAFQTQFARDKNQYQTHVKDLNLAPDEDECGLFTAEGEKKYLPLQVVAGNLNMEDTAEIMKELARNPHKLIQANQAAKDGDWAAVKAMFKKISGSIKNNQASLATHSKAAEPLSHLKSSSGGSSNREMTLEDYRNDKSLYF